MSWFLCTVLIYTHHPFPKEEMFSPSLSFTFYSFPLCLSVFNAGSMQDTSSSFASGQGHVCKNTSFHILYFFILVIYECSSTAGGAASCHCFHDNRMKLAAPWLGHVMFVSTYQACLHAMYRSAEFAQLLRT